MHASWVYNCMLQVPRVAMLGGVARALKQGMGATKLIASATRLSFRDACTLASILLRMTRPCKRHVLSTVLTYNNKNVHLSRNWRSSNTSTNPCQHHQQQPGPIGSTQLHCALCSAYDSGM
jgi:hypothetical protein